MRILPLLTLGLCVSVAQAQPNEVPATVPVGAAPGVEAPLIPTPKPRPGDPSQQITADLKAFFGVLNALETQGIQNNWQVSTHLSGARVGFFGGQEWAEYFVAQRGASQFRLDDLEFVSLEERAARVKVNYTLISVAPTFQQAGQAPRGGEKIEQKESQTLDLRREIVPWDKTEKWRIVAPAREDIQAYRALTLRNIAYHGGQRAGTLPQLRGEISATRLKQVGLGVMQFAQDYDEIFRFQNEFWRDAIRPYVKNEALFQIPGTRDFYTFNDHLSEKNLNAIGDVARTVLFYEGKDEEPIFRYDGKAAICFADGHVELITRAQEQTLIWRPKAL